MILLTWFDHFRGKGLVKEGQLKKLYLPVKTSCTLMKMLTHWLPEFSAKNTFLDILEIFRLDIREISSKLLQKAFATWQHSFLSTRVVFYDIFAQACTEIKILRFWMRK